MQETHAEDLQGRMLPVARMSLIDFFVHGLAGSPANVDKLLTLPFGDARWSDVPNVPKRTCD